jgi:adenylate cyclase class IV
MARNLELKSRLHDLPSARLVAARLSGGQPQVLEQVDTYFFCPRGRLKLREIPGEIPHLVAYVRPDQSAARTSDYLLVPVSDAPELKAALAAALGVWGTVHKRREVSLVENVRVHLDEVERLGTFLEFEAVLHTPEQERLPPAQLDRLSQEFGLEPGDFIAGSYSDLLLPPFPGFATNR